MRFSQPTRTFMFVTTLVGVVAAARQICEEQECEFLPATTAEIAAAFRRGVPLPDAGPDLELDTRGRAGWAIGR